MADRHNRDIDRPRAPLPEPLPVPTVEVLLIFSGIIHDLINWCIREKISHTAFAKSLCYIDENIKSSFHPSGAA